MKPYYRDEWVTIYNMDCREGMKEIPDGSIDLVLTDPPYPSQHLEYGDSDITFLQKYSCLQLIFWSARDSFPLDYTAIHIWDKWCGNISVYERIFERHGKTCYKVYRGKKIMNFIDAQMNRDIVTGHPSQKPQRVITDLIAEYSEPNNTIFDPFLGSGTTAYCAKKLNRHCIGFEISEKYCEIAARRCSQGVFNLSVI